MRLMRIKIFTCASMRMDPHMRIIRMNRMDPHPHAHPYPQPIQLPNTVFTDISGSRYLGNKDLNTKLREL